MTRQWRGMITFHCLQVSLARRSAWDVWRSRMCESGPVSVYGIEYVHIKPRLEKRGLADVGFAVVRCGGKALLVLLGTGWSVTEQLVVAKIDSRGATRWTPLRLHTYATSLRLHVARCYHPSQLNGVLWTVWGALSLFPNRVCSSTPSLVSCRRGCVRSSADCLT
jgi:hypothetical protein